MEGRHPDLTRRPLSIILRCQAAPAHKTSRKDAAMTEHFEPGLISIIIPAYNHENYVGPAIRSAIDQTYHNLELLVVDDGSSDGTWEAVKSLEADCRERFRRVELIRQENRGICETLNTLLEAARGEYFLRLDSDDQIKPWSVEKQHAFLRDNPDFVLTVGDNEIIDENGQTVYWTTERLNTSNPEQAAFKTFGDFLRWNRPDLDFNSDGFGAYETFWDNYIPNGYLVRKKAMERIKFTTEAPREDFFMMLQLAKMGRFKFFDEILHSYRWHATNNIKNPETGATYTRMTQKHELRLLKVAGDQARYMWLFDRLMNWKTRTKLKLGNWLELYRIMDIYDERKRYRLRLGSRDWPLFELVRDNTTAVTPWRLRLPRSGEDFDF